MAIRLFSSEDPPIPWPGGAWRNDHIQGEAHSAFVGYWYARAFWRDCSSNSWSRWRWLATLKALRKVTIFRLFHRFVRNDDIYPHWYLFLRGDW